MSQRLIFSNDVSAILNAELMQLDADRVFVLTDSNVSQYVMPLIDVPEEVEIIEIAHGDDNKTVATAQQVWSTLSCKGATRRSVLVNIGGGVVTDLGGFVASTFKRGIRFINVPTTLLAAVDASVGGKTGVNSDGLKNEIGVFSEAQSVIISSAFFDTLPHSELLSGYAEMLKHGLLSSHGDTAALLTASPSDFSIDEMLALLQQSVSVKEGIVMRDPTEKGERKVLNLGHTVGHAIESLSLRRSRPVPHGYAVAWGLVVELVLSNMQLGFDSTLLRQVASYVSQNYGQMPVSCDDYDTLIELMSHDKKNRSSASVNFTLLAEAGRPVYDHHIADTSLIEAAFDIARDAM